MVWIRTPSGRGSGFFVNRAGLIVTNQHVVGSAFTVKVDLYDRSTHIAKVLRRDSVEDVALLKIEPDADIAGLPVCHSGTLTVGEPVVAIGNPLSLANTVTQGIVSGIRTSEARRLIQTDVAINAGNSGGPLINRWGAVVGIVTEKVASEGVEGLGFALPISEALYKLGVNVQTQTQGPVDACGNPTQVAVGQVEARSQPGLGTV
jgi:serine protease Do